MPTIPNTTIVLSSTGRMYRITPDENYVLHGKSRDWEEENLETGEIILHRGYSTSTAGVSINYDFENTTVIDGYTAYGVQEFFARPRNEVPENQIFGGGNNDHELQ